MSASSFAHGQLNQLVARIERLEEEKKTISDDIKEVYHEAKGNGFDTKVLRALIALRKKDAADRAEHDAMMDVYMAALGMLPDDDVPNSNTTVPSPPMGQQGAPTDETDDPGEPASQEVYVAGKSSEALHQSDPALRGGLQVAGEAVAGDASPQKGVDPAAADLAFPLFLQRNPEARVIP